MPEGFVQEREISFEGDGVYKTRSEVTFENGCVYNRVKLNGNGFKEDGNILGKKLEFSAKASTMMIISDEKNNALDARFHKVSKSIYKLNIQRYACKSNESSNKLNYCT